MLGTKIKNIDLSELVKPGVTDTISGRSYGEQFEQNINFTNLIKNGVQFNFIIDDSKIKAINDSFIKGLFNKLFQTHIGLDFVRDNIKIDGNEYFKTLFEKNWLILYSLHNV